MRGAGGKGKERYRNESRKKGQKDDRKMHYSQLCDLV